MNIIICGHTFSFLSDIYLGVVFPESYSNSVFKLFINLEKYSSIMCSYVLSAPFLLSFPLGLPNCICISNLGFHQNEKIFFLKDTIRKMLRTVFQGGCATLHSHSRICRFPFLCILTYITYYHIQPPTSFRHRTPLPPQPSHSSQHVSASLIISLGSLPSWICPSA